MSGPNRPLFRIDPGWLFILAGLVVCAAGVLLPAQANLQSLQRQLQRLRSEEVQAYARLKAHADFLDAVDQSEPGLVRRLAAAQLNLIPESDTPVLLASADATPVTGWIDATVHVDIRPSTPVLPSTLARLVNGPHRLWIFGGGILCIFVGALLGPSSEHAHAQADAAIPLEVDQNSYPTTAALRTLEPDATDRAGPAEDQLPDCHDDHPPESHAAGSNDGGEQVAAPPGCAADIASPEQLSLWTAPYVSESSIQPDDAIDADHGPRARAVDGAMD